MAQPPKKSILNRIECAVTLRHNIATGQQMVNFKSMDKASINS